MFVGRPIEKHWPVAARASPYPFCASTFRGTPCNILPWPNQVDSSFMIRVTTRAHVRATSVLLEGRKQHCALTVASERQRSAATRFDQSRDQLCHLRSYENVEDNGRSRSRAHCLLVWQVEPDGAQVESEQRLSRMTEMWTLILRTWQPATSNREFVEAGIVDGNFREIANSGICEYKWLKFEPIAATIQKSRECLIKIGLWVSSPLCLGLRLSLLSQRYFNSIAHFPKVCYSHLT